MRSEQREIPPFAGCAAGGPGRGADHPRGEPALGLARRGAQAALTATIATLILAAPAQAFGEPSGFAEARDRGVHYHRKGLHKAAIVELDKALAMPEGREDFRTHYMLARSTYELLHLERTFPIARRADELAPSPRARRKSSALLKELESFYGGVVLEKAPEARTDKGYVYLEDVGGLINTRKKEVFAKLRDRYRTTPSRLPATIYLPFGEFTANRVPFSTRRGATERILIIPDAAASEGGVFWWAAGGAAALLTGAAMVAALLTADEEPSTTLRLAAPAPAPSPPRATRSAAR